MSSKFCHNRTKECIIKKSLSFFDPHGEQGKAPSIPHFSGANTLRIEREGNALQFSDGKVYFRKKRKKNGENHSYTRKPVTYCTREKRCNITSTCMLTFLIY